VNNADRKGGHVLLDRKGRVWSIDHGICFHSDFKLRTVIWEFAGEPIPRHLVNDLQRFEGQLKDGDGAHVEKLQQLLTEREMDALQQRLARLRKRPIFPEPGPGRHYPWPPV
jgi:uncharacterized repeat protein (TIGR03843 family)